MGLFLYRIMGAAILDAGVYETIEADRRATVQAALVVVLAALAAGIGAGGIYGPKISTLALAAGLALITWVSWATLTVQVGTRWLAEPATAADTGQMLRTLGFAASPGLLQALAILPRISTVIFLVAWIWMLAAMVVAVKHALDFRSTWRAIAVCAATACLCGCLAFAIGLLFGPALS